MAQAATLTATRLAHEYLSPEQVCEQLPGLTPQTLAMWRYRNRGPGYKKLGRTVVYPADLLQKWLDAAPGFDGARR